MRSVFLRVIKPYVWLCPSFIVVERIITRTDIFYASYWYVASKHFLSYLQKPKLCNSFNHSFIFSCYIGSFFLVSFVSQFNVFRKFIFSALDNLCSIKCNYPSYLLSVTLQLLNGCHVCSVSLWTSSKKTAVLVTLLMYRDHEAICCCRKFPYVLYLEEIKK